MNMPGHLQFQAPSALDYFAALVADDDSLSLLESAVAIAQDEEPGLDVQGLLAKVDELGLRLKRRIAADTAALQKLRLLNRYFFQELGFGGNVNDYYDPRNSLLPHVLESRRGIPITLAVLYMELASQVGIQARGVSFPGHFLVKVHMPLGEVVIDPFSGQSLSREELDERLLPYRQQCGLAGEDELPLALFLQPAPQREVIARMLRNLREIHRSRCDWTRLAQVQERLVILLPQSWEERREHALVLAELGAHQKAVKSLALYLQHCPNAGDAPALRRRLLAWQKLQ
jgi:regulator of sirC expression with transglutaminase-like and TPR domain